MANEDRIMKQLNRVFNAPETCCDIETPGKASTHVTAIAFSLNADEAVVCPMGGRYFDLEFERTTLWPCIRSILAQVPVIGQNFLFDWTILLQHAGVRHVNLQWDTMVAQHLLYTDFPRSLPALIAQYTDFMPHKHMIEEDLDLYNGLDVCTTHHVKHKQVEQIAAQPAHEAELDFKQMTHLMELHPVLVLMEMRGLPILSDFKEHARQQMVERQRIMEDELAEMAGRRLNPRSTPQLRTFFYEEQGYKPYFNKDTGKSRCDEDALQRLQRKGSTVAGKILEIREVRNMLEKYWNMRIDDDDRIRCQIKPTGTATGRLATAQTPRGTGGNLQNLPPEFGEAVVPDEGYIFMEADLDQAEKRLVALITQDTRNINDFKEGHDIHVEELARVWRCDPSEITKEQRNKIGKPLNHMTSYGVGPNTFAANLGIPAAEGKKILHDYYHVQHPQLTQFFKEIRDHLRYKSCSIRNLFGRPRRFLGARDENEFRSAYDFIPQSTIGEICNRALVDLYKHGPDWLLIYMQNHDSLLLGVPDDPDYLETAWPLVEWALHYTFTYGDYSLGIPVEFNLLPCWSKKHAVEVEENTTQGMLEAYNKLKGGSV